MLEMLLPLVAFGALFYFLLIRPQQKRMREHQETINALQPGTRVLLQSGIYGTLTHIGERQVIVELAPSLEVTALKAAIMRVVAADEEEFEFDDDAPEGETEVVENALEGGTEVVDTPDPTEEPAASDEATGKS